MHEKICCFCGHRKISNNNIKDLVKFILIDLIQNQNYNTFYSGGMGDFDILCESVVRKLKDDFPYIKLCRIIYKYSLHFKEIQELFDEIIVVDLEDIHFKRLIAERNKWMVNKSDAVVCCVNKKEGGAYSMMEYANANGKEVILVK